MILIIYKYIKILKIIHRLIEISNKIFIKYLCRTQRLNQSTTVNPQLDPDVMAMHLLSIPFPMVSYWFPRLAALGGMERFNFKPICMSLAPGQLHPQLCKGKPSYSPILLFHFVIPSPSNSYWIAHQSSELLPWTRNPERKYSSTSLRLNWKIITLKLTKIVTSTKKVGTT